MTTRARAACLAYHGYDPHMINVDQKPLHMNESGSQGQMTLAPTGQRDIEVKELHTATRARWSANTCCVSNPLLAQQLPPLECLFKGGFTNIANCILA